MAGPWTRLGVRSRGELRLGPTLMSGQLFRWSEDAAGVFTGVLGRRVVALRECGDAGDADIEARVVVDGSQAGDGASAVPLKEELRGFFQLEVPLEPLYREWAAADARFGRAVEDAELAGLRCCRQDPAECLLTFVCTSNNNVPRIRQLVSKLAGEYGDPIGTVDGEAVHAFPTIGALRSRATEVRLRELGFGYRAKFIVGLVAALEERGGAGWLASLRGMATDDVRGQLQELPGVGPKVADCVALFALDKADLVPVDTHMFQLACEYLPGLRGKSLTSKRYIEVLDFFRGLLGPRAGWAHTVLFSRRMNARGAKRAGGAGQEGENRAKKRK